MFFLFCVLFWGLVFTAITFANENGKNEPVAQVNGGDASYLDLTRHLRTAFVS